MSGPITACQSCGGQLTEFLDLGYHPPTSVFPSSRSSGPKTLYPLAIFRCESCGLVNHGYATDPELLFGKDSVEYFYRSSATASFKKHLEDFAERMIRERHPKFVVDIGGNDGTALKKYAEAGIKVLNVDPSSVAEGAPVPTMNDFFDAKLVHRIIREWGQPDLITAYNVFAHTPLEETMRGIAGLLKPDGVFVNESQYLAGIISEVAYDTFYLEHLRVYSVHTMASMLERWGFSIIGAERIQGIGDSIRVFAKKGEWAMGDDTLTLLGQEVELGLQNPQTYVDFAARVRQSKTDLNALLWKLKKEGNRIMGIGAPGRSTTIINYCGLTPDLIDYLVDTSPLKVGRFSPGTEIPVVDEARLIADQPEYAVNFLWYLPEIVPKLRAKGFKGKFITPIPEVKILE